MATPLISGNPEAQAFLREQFRRQHQYSLFEFQRRLTKAEARAEAWARMRAEMERQRYIAEMQRRAMNATIQ